MAAPETTGMEGITYITSAALAPAGMTRAGVTGGASRFQRTAMVNYMQKNQ